MHSTMRLGGGASEFLHTQKYTLVHKTSPFFILLYFLQTLTDFYNIWPTAYGVNLQYNNKSPDINPIDC